MAKSIDVPLTLDGKTVETYTVNYTGETNDSGDPCAAACIFDGANRGMWMVNAVVELARALGWTGKDSQEDIDAHEQSGLGGEPLLADTANDAENWLNELTPAGWTFGHSEGDFFLANSAWWETAAG